MKKVVVKFLQTVSPYQSGEIAGFEPDVAQKLIAEKKAVEHKETNKKDGTKNDPVKTPTPSPKDNTPGNGTDPATGADGPSDPAPQGDGQQPGDQP